MKYLIYNSSGEIVQTGSCPPGEMENQEVSPGLFIMEGEADPEKDIVNTVTNQIVVGGKPPPPVDMDYRKARYAAYPSVQEQMDMLWHAMDTNVLPKVEPFYSEIKAVKEAYPTDNSVMPNSVIIYRN